MRNKKGVSPLLAAVLLIAFAIAMSAVVSTFVLKKTREFDPNKLSEQSVFCESVNLGYTVDAIDDLGFFNPPGEPGVELFGNITLINRGAFSIHKLVVTAPGFPSTDYYIINSSNLRDTLKPGVNNKYNISIQLNSSLDNKEIKMVPVIKDPEKNQFVICTDRQLIINYSQLCTEVGSC